MVLNELCSKCGKNGMECQCENFHPNMEGYEIYVAIDEHIFNLTEIKAIYRTIEHQFISYEDREAHEVFNRISKIIRESK